MSNICFDQQSYKSLLPIPKKNLFMRKMAKIQAIDRQMRKKWIKIKRHNQKVNLAITQKDNFSPLKNQSSQKQNLQRQQIYERNLNPSFVKNLQSQLKRQNIIFNHKKNEEIFYRKRQKSRYAQCNQLYKIQNSKPKGFFSSSFDSPKRRVKTQVIQKEQQNYENQTQYIKVQQVQLNSLNKKQQDSFSFKNKKRQIRLFLSPSILRQKQERIQSLSTKNKHSSLKLPQMFSKPKSTKQKQKQIIASRSQMQLMQLQVKKKHNYDKWTNNRMNLLKKLQGSKAYYIMKSPLRLEEHSNMYYC